LEAGGYVLARLQGIDLRVGIWVGIPLGVFLGLRFWEDQTIFASSLGGTFFETKQIFGERVHGTM
jgi:hypothetical protein